MEGTYEKRRRPATGSHTRNRTRSALAPREKRRLIQLAVSVCVFALVFVGRGIFPDQIAQWKLALRQDTDFREAFSSFGQAISEGEPVLDTLGELWVEVFAGGAVVEPETDSVWQQSPAFSDRIHAQMHQPTDAVSVWYQTNKVILTTPIQPQQEEPAAVQPQSGAVTGASDGPATQTKTILLGGETLTIQAALPAQPAVVTAQAQDYTDAGEALPASVSMQFYTLGLANTVNPVSGTLTSDYGYRDHPVSGSYIFHRGIDVGVPTGTPILAFADGTVEFTGESSESGLYVQINHGNGVSTFYAHCSKITVQEGETVRAGQTVAEAGETGNATGPHLHFALIKDGIYLDPLYYIEVN